MIAAGVILILAGALAVTASAAQGAGNGTQEACCFTNRAYAGVCQVSPTEGETCESILEYLNSPMSSGKGYCNNTEIRGGWRLIDCHHSARKHPHHKERSKANTPSTRARR